MAISTRSTRLTDYEVRAVVRTATAAPSVHNTQPWRFGYVDDCFELSVDASRQLRVADPAGRELVISCGAALYTLCLSVRRLGLEPRLQQLPEEREPHLLARVKVLPGGPPTAGEIKLLAAVHRRHTHRGAFGESSPTTAVLDDLRIAARMEGALLAVLPEGPRAQAVVDLAWQAAESINADLQWRVETGRWSGRSQRARADGVPVSAFPSDLPHRDSGQLPGRDFGQGARVGWAGAARPGGSVLVVLSTEGDGPGDWLRAGRALQHVLLRAAQDWLFAAYATQPLELPAVRSLLQHQCGIAGYPQMLFRLGHASTITPTPRRDHDEVFVIDE